MNFATGTPGLPAFHLAGTNLVMRGNAWRSYWTEARDTTSQANSWQFFQRIPLTNEFQIIAPAAEANREFRGWEFIADPFALVLTVQPGVNIQPVFYGPANHTFEIRATTNLTPVAPWEIYDTVAMTNTFRIFPPEPVTASQRYFKVSEL